MEHKDKGKVLEKRAFRVAARFNYVLFPLDLRDFERALSRLKFATFGGVPQEPVAAGPDVHIGGQGNIAKKGEVTVDVNTEKQFIGVAGPDASTTLPELFGILDELKQILDTNRILFFELQARYRAQPAASPILTLKKLGQDSRITKEGTKIFGKPMDLFSARLISGPEGPNSPNYLEVWLQPIASMSDRLLGISVIFRSDDAKQFRSFSTELEKYLLRFVESLG